MNRDAFFDLANRLSAGLLGDEVLFCNLDGEDSDFIRLNRNRVRQAGSVRRRSLDLSLISGGRQVIGNCELTGDPVRDEALAGILLARLRQRLPHVPDDPYLDFSGRPSSSERLLGGNLPNAGQAVSELIDGAGQMDLVGIWAGGDVLSGLASSLGHCHWHRSTSFNLDWSCYLDKDKAVKAVYSGFEWESA